jgi:hypothetical protein
MPNFQSINIEGSIPTGSKIAIFISRGASVPAQTTGQDSLESASNTGIVAYTQGTTSVVPTVSIDTYAQYVTATGNFNTAMASGTGGVEAVFTYSKVGSQFLFTFGPNTLFVSTPLYLEILGTALTATPTQSLALMTLTPTIGSTAANIPVDTLYAGIYYKFTSLVSSVTTTYYLWFAPLTNLNVITAGTAHQILSTVANPLYLYTSVSVATGGLPDYTPTGICANPAVDTGTTTAGWLTAADTGCWYTNSVSANYLYWYNYALNTDNCSGGFYGLCTAAELTTNSAALCTYDTVNAGTKKTAGTTPYTCTPTVTPTPTTKTFWAKYKWYIIGGIIGLVVIIIFIVIMVMISKASKRKNLITQDTQSYVPVPQPQVIYTPQPPSQPQYINRMQDMYPPPVLQQQPIYTPQTIERQTTTIQQPQMMR